MEIVALLEKMNNFLDKSFVFQSVKFLLGFYMIIIVLTMLGILFRIGKIYLTVLIAGQEFPNITKGKLQKNWERILGLMESGDSRNWKIAILEVAQMLDEVLKTVRYPGDTLGDKLNGMVEVQLRNLEQVKEANKIKNRIVQDDGFEISKEEARRIIDIFADSLRFFEVIE